MRPKPEIIASVTNNDTYIIKEIYRAVGIYAILYDGEPIGIRTRNIYLDYPGPKYHRTFYAAPGHAIKQAEKLNKEFKTDKFTMTQITI